MCVYFIIHISEVGVSGSGGHPQPGNRGFVLVLALRLRCVRACAHARAVWLLTFGLAFGFFGLALWLEMCLQSPAPPPPL